MTKPTFKPRGRPDNKNVKTYETTNTQRGPISANNCQGFNSNSKRTSIFSKKSASTEPECVNSANADLELSRNTLHSSRK